MIANGIDPGQARKVQKSIQIEQTENSFEAIAREWHGKYSSKWADSHAKKIIRRFELYIFPWHAAIQYAFRHHLIGLLF